eukprot:jgi/Tetstr1/458159/TSEL_044650.t1
MATRRNGPGGLFHSLEGLPLFDPNGPVRRYGARGHDMLAAVPPLYMAAALLVLLFTSVGLMTSLAAANGQVAEMSAVLSGLQEQLGLHAEADAEATNYREALQAKIDEMETLAADNTQLQSDLATASESRTKLQARVAELQAQESDCTTTISTLMTDIKTKVRAGLQHEQQAIIQYIETLKPELPTHHAQPHKGPGATATPDPDGGETPTPTLMPTATPAL